MRFWLLLTGVIAPTIYVALAMAGPLLWPGYDLSTRMISELGMAEAPLDAVFNIGLMVAGSLTMLFSLGLFGELRRRGADVITAALAGLTVAVFGGSLVVGGVFPLPDERHLAWSAGFAVQVAPLLTLLALRKAAGLTGLKIFLGVVFLALNALLAVMFGIGDLIGQDNLGLWQRAYGLAMFPWIALTALTLMAAPSARTGVRSAFAVR
jgi:hypothetical membrane protein